MRQINLLCIIVHFVYNSIMTFDVLYVIITQAYQMDDKLLEEKGHAFFIFIFPVLNTQNSTVFKSNGGMD